jgi:hypothetical protein
MGYSCEKQKGPKSASLIISNHNTDLDPVLVALGFTRHMYFLASEHAFRAGFASKILKNLFAPIPFNKSKTDGYAIKEMIRRLKAGASVCLFAEGDRSFNGQTVPIGLSTAKLVKTSGAGLITFRLNGAYLTSPRWAKYKRKGRITGAVVNTYSKAELAKMTTGEVLGVIQNDLFEDAYKRQTESMCRYPGKNLAENIETVLYLCAGCKKIGTIKSENDRFYCNCGLGGIYNEFGFLEGDSLPFTTITEWDNWQTSELAEIFIAFGDKTICTDENQLLYEIQPAICKTLIGEGQMSIDRQAFHCAGRIFPLTDITQFAITGQMVLLFGLKDGGSFEVRSPTPRSALKYRAIFNVLIKENK